MSSATLKCGAFCCGMQPYICNATINVNYMCVCVKTLNNKVHALEQVHQYGTNLVSTNLPTQEDASLCQSERLMHG